MATVNADGTPTIVAPSGPFGEQLPNSIDPKNAANGSTYNYVGIHAKQTETKFTIRPIQMGARVYIPGLGRFLQIDPVEGGTLNNYVYAMDPVNQKDLSGEFLWFVYAAVVLVGFVGGYMAAATVGESGRAKPNPAPAPDPKPAPSPAAKPQYVERAVWDSQNNRVKVYPTQKARKESRDMVISFLGGVPGPSAKQNVEKRETAWREVITMEPRANAPGMRDQFICHWDIATYVMPNKESWNLDLGKPDVGYLNAVRDHCNPS